MPNKVRVWDLPTRVFHWLLAAGVVGSVITGYVGGGAIDWHARLGYAALTLLLFRLVWGFVGGHWSRFATFVYSPRSVGAYLRGRAHPDHLVGHNPLGAASVFAMLLFLLAQVTTGLFSSDDISFSGPLNVFVSDASGKLATWYHKRIGKWIVITLVLLHVGAIAYYLRRKKDNLIAPMIGGDKEVAQVTRSSRDDATMRIAALVLLGLCGAFVAWLVGLRPEG
jgi:cytochrome b